MLPVHACHAQTQRTVEQVQVSAGFDPAFLVRASGRSEHRADIVVRLRRINIDDAGDGVLAEQAALRAAENLDPVDIEQAIGDELGAIDRQLIQ